MAPKLLLAVLLALVVPLAVGPAVEASGGVAVVRVLANGDAYLVALSSYCTAQSDRSPPLGVRCVLLDALGYDGWTGAHIATYGHQDHPWTCRVVSSLAGPAVNGLPTPLDLVASDSLIVGIDDGSDWLDYYGDRFRNPPPGAVQNRVIGALHTADVATLAATPQWYAERVEYGAQPVVSGPYAGLAMILWYQGNADATVECAF